MHISLGRLVLAGVLVIGAVLWLRVNKPVEGRTLIELSSRHGITTADLLSLAALLLAVLVAWPTRD